MNINNYKTDESENLNINELEDISNNLRCDVLKMIHIAKSGHPGGSLSAADIVTSLYFNIMNIDPGSPYREDRDRFILSKGHCCPIWYAALSKRGYFDRKLLWKLREINYPLQGHPDMNKTIGIDMTTGSLGNGLSIGCGMALHAKIFNKSFYTYVLLGDGEIDEGIVWEAAMTAAKYKLGNLVAFIDYNHLQLDGTTDEVMPLEPLADKWEAFNWHVQSIDGHNIQEILRAVDIAKKTTNSPSAIIANTVKGRGVSFMENKCDWHGIAPNDEEYTSAISSLKSKEKSKFGRIK
ncbi:MAG: transketolase [Actinobacteria bacterium]|nr:transketolase [Actinomycetota bacterium]MCL5072587.1 transketolase [Actinomycetota bacterium]